MKPSLPKGEMRASARAAALSDPTSNRFSRSSAVSLNPVRRYVVEARETSDRCTVTGIDSAAPLSRNTSAVITFVMLAMDR